MAIYSTDGEQPLYDNVITPQRGNFATQQQQQQPPRVDHGFEVYFADFVNQQGGLRRSGNDYRLGPGEFEGKTETELRTLMRSRWDQMKPEARQAFVERGRKIEAARGLGIAYPEGGGRVAAPRPASGGQIRGSTSATQFPPPRSAPAGAGRAEMDYYTQNPGAYVDQQIQARNTQLAQSGITDMGGGNMVMNNRYGSGFVTQADPTKPRPPARFFDEKGEVDLNASRIEGQTAYRSGDASADKTKLSATIAQQQQQIAGAGLPLTDPNTPQNRLAADRSQAISKLTASPEFKARMDQADAESHRRGVAITDRELSGLAPAQQEIPADGVTRRTLEYRHSQRPAAGPEITRPSAPYTGARGTLPRPDTQSQSYDGGQSNGLPIEQPSRPPTPQSPAPPKVMEQDNLLERLDDSVFRRASDYQSRAYAAAGQRRDNAYANAGARRDYAMRHGTSVPAATGETVSRVRSRRRG